MDSLYKLRSRLGAFVAHDLLLEVAQLRIAQFRLSITNRFKSGSIRLTAKTKPLRSIALELTRLHQQDHLQRSEFDQIDL